MAIKPFEVNNFGDYNSAKMQSNVADFANQLKTMPAFNGTLESDVAQIESDIIQIQSAGTQIQADIIQIQSDIGQIESDITLINAQLLLLTSMPFVNGAMLYNVSLILYTIVPTAHPLGRIPVGYLITKINAPETVYSSTMTASVVYFSASGPVTVDIWIY